MFLSKSDQVRLIHTHPPLSLSLSSVCVCKVNKYEISKMLGNYDRIDFQLSLTRLHPCTSILQSRAKTLRQRTLRKKKRHPNFYNRY